MICQNIMHNGSSSGIIDNQLKIDKCQNTIPSGCYVKATNGRKGDNHLMIPLKSIDYEIIIMDTLYQVKMQQEYYNPTEVNLEIQFKFPIPLNACVSKMKAQFDGWQISGIIKQKEQAKQQYNKAIQTGKQAVFANIDENSKDIMNVLIGNIRPKVSVTINVSFINQVTLVMNCFYKIMIMSRTSPRYLCQADKLRNQKSSNISCLNRVTKQAGSIQWSFKVTLRSSRKITCFKCKSHKLKQISQVIDPQNNQIVLILEKEQFPSKDFQFLFSTKQFFIPACSFNQNDESSTAMISFIPRYCNLSSQDAYKAYEKGQDFQVDFQIARGQYIFVIDRSGSMQGQRIKKAKKALKDLLRSLPLKSYFNIVSFGNKHSFMFPKSAQYTDKNLEIAERLILDMQANMGGTNILETLQSLLNQSIIQGYPRQIFILTDGAVNNTEMVIQIIAKKVKHVRIHAIGIGNGASQALIKGCAKEGKGSFTFLNDRSNFSVQIGEILKQIITPIIDQINLDYDQSIVQTIIPNPKSIPFILKNDLVNFFIIFKAKLQRPTNIKISYTDPSTQQKISDQILISPLKCTQQNGMINKYAQYRIINTLERIKKLYNQNQIKNATKQLIKMDEQIDIITNIVKRSIKNQILCSHTAYIFVGKHLSDQKFEQHKHIKTSQISIIQPEFQYKSQINLNINAVQSPKGVKKPHRFRPGSVALRQIRRYRQTTDFLIPKKNMRALIKQIASQISAYHRFSSSAFEAIQQAAQSYLGNILQKANFCAQNCNRKQLKSEDIQLASKLIHKQDLFKEIISKEENSMKHYQSELPKWRLVSRSRRNICKKNRLQNKIDQKKFLSYSKNKKFQIIISQMKVCGKWVDEQIITKLYEQNKLHENDAYNSLLQRVDHEFMYTYLVVNWIKKQKKLSPYLFMIKKSQFFIDAKIKQLNQKQKIDLQSLCRQANFTDGHSDIKKKYD